MIRVEAPPELKNTLRKVSGDRVANEDLDAFETAMIQYPAAAAKLGNLAIHTQATIMHRMFGDGNQGIMLAVLEHTSQLKAQLGYESSNPIDRSLIDHCVTCWLRLNETELRYEAVTGDGSTTLTRQEHWERRLSMAQHRYLKSVESLAKVRRLLSGVPLMQVNVNSQVANVGTVQR